MEKCCECNKTFSTLYNLRKHSKKFHPDKVNEVAPKKKFKYRCEPCKRNFNRLKDFTYHNNKRHSTEIAPKKSTANLRCVLCQLSAIKAELLIHFKTKHNVEIKTDKFEFNSSEEFVDWKIKLENSTRAHFVKQTGNVCTNNNKTIIKFRCHRSGNYISKGKGLRHIKAQGSNKINGFCPACIKVEVENNKYHVSLINQHVGHGPDLEHLSLTSQEREKLANQMALKIPFTEILEQVRHSVQGSLEERIHLLTRKDLHNIERSFNLQSPVIRHQNDAVSAEAWVTEKASNECAVFYKVQEATDEENGILTSLGASNSRMLETDISDESKLIQEKAKIKTNLIPNLIKIVENISCMEQVNMFKKLCAPIEPTLSAIANRHEKIKKPTPSDFGPHNKKIIPQRGKLHSTKKKRKN